MTFRDWFKKSEFKNMPIFLITEIDCSYQNLTSLNGVEKLKYLKFLNLDSNNISSLEPIKKLEYLNWLFFNDNNVESLDPIKNLQNLSSLFFCNNKVSTLEPIKDLNNIKEVGCINNNIKDLSFIPKNLNGLHYEQNPVYEIFENKSLESIYEIIKEYTTKALKKINTQY